jgi:type I restriction enzyme S subunit
MIPPSSDGGRWLSLRVANIQDWRLDLADRKFVSLPASMVARHSVQDGDLLLARAIASEEHLGKAVVVYPGDGKWAFDSHLMRLRFDSTKAVPEFVRQLLMTSGGRSMFLRAARRSAVQFNINTVEISKLKIPVPPIHLQREFLRRAKTVERQRTANESALRAANELFASLQYSAFRGEL